MEQRNIQIEKSIKANSGRLLGFIKKFVKRTEEAEDILQDVLYQFVMAYDQIRSIDQVTSWLFRVARNRVTDNHRKKKPSSFTDLLTRDDDTLYLEELLPDPASLPDRQLLGEVIWEKLDDILAKLPENQRQVFIWHEFEQLSFKEISERTGEPVNTLISRKRYAIIMLREELGELYDDLFND